MTLIDSEIHRHIEGGNADFLDGCVLSGFNLNPSIRITNKLSIKSDANTILLSWRPSAELGPTVMKAVLQSVAGSLRFCHRPPPNVRGRWHTNTIAGFYQPEHAQAAIKHFNGSPDVEAHLVYTVYFTAPKELSDAVMVDVEDIASQIPEAKIIWEEPRNNMVTLRLSGTKQDKIVDMKKILEAVFAGRVANGGLPQAVQCEIWHDFFATSPGEVWLQHLARDTGVIIMSDKLQRRLRIYDPQDNGNHIGYVEQKLAQKAVELNAWRESHSVQLDPKEFRKLVASDTVAKAQRILGKANVSLDILKKKLVLHCSRQTAWQLTYNLNLPPPPPSTTALAECPQCGDATDDIKYSTCGHVACRDCFDHQTQVASSDLTGKHFPLVCWHENCEQPIPIPDLRRYATGNVVDALLKAALTYHIRSCPDLYRNCRTPDCRSVYLRHGSYEIFTCPTCLTQTCTKCHAAPHVGWSCAEYDKHLQKSQINEQLLNDYKAIAGTKECPKCATLIEKVDGCNHVECSGCHGHICWVCVKVFTRSEAAYQHMNDAHGGNGLVEEEGDDEESGSESEGWEDEGDDDDEWDAHAAMETLDMLDHYIMHRRW